MRGANRPPTPPGQKAGRPPAGDQPKRTGRELTGLARIVNSDSPNSRADRAAARLIAGMANVGPYPYRGVPRVRVPVYCHRYRTPARVRSHACRGLHVVVVYGYACEAAYAIRRNRGTLILLRYITAE